MPSVSGNVGAVASVSSVFGRNGGVVAANGDYSGVVATHLTGATAATRYVGGTASGAPVAGTFAVGDFVIEQTGKVYVCTVAGTPGTWVSAGGFSPARDVGQASYSASAVSVAGSGQADIPFTFGQGDAALVSLAVPTAPAPAAAGTYAYAVLVQQDAGGAGNPFSASLTVDLDFYGAAVVGGTAGTAATPPGTSVPLAVTWFGSAASAFTVTVHNEASGTDHFTVVMYLQRLT